LKAPSTPTFQVVISANSNWFNWWWMYHRSAKLGFSGLVVFY
jgi:hypothetical protein